jgi:hypothetical protein
MVTKIEMYEYIIYLLENLEDDEIPNNITWYLFYLKRRLKKLKEKKLDFKVLIEHDVELDIDY